jgi:5-formyltetrahydrofolate cyclo-ligase
MGTKRSDGEANSSDTDTGAPGSYSSPACYLGELEGAGVEAAMKSWEDIRAWRKQTREALIASRMALRVGVRQEKGEKAKARLLELVDLKKYPTLGIYWPMRGEIDVRDIARKHVEAGGAVALPVVVEKGAPVEFWNWRPGMPMRRGVWNIPIPLDRDVLIPEALIVPLVGFDGSLYRLGYGGGYYDRTLAAATPRPFCVGLGFAEARLASIFPQPHDVPMDVIVVD